MRQTNLSSLIWSLVDLLRGVCQQSEFGEEILSRPFCGEWTVWWKSTPK